VTIALCLNCGKIKIGALCPCPGCGLSSSGDVDLDLLFSDHHLTPESLSQLGRVIGNIRSSTTDDELFSSTVLHFVQLQNPNLLTCDVESSQLKEVKRLLASLNFPPVMLAESETEHQDDEESESRAMNKPERTNEELDDLILDDDDFLPGAALADASSDDSSVDGNKQNRTFQPGSERLFESEATDSLADNDFGIETASERTRLCPRCMQSIDDFRKVQRGSETQFFCPDCSESVPFRYVADYDKVARIKLSLAGMSGHGKTMFLRGIYSQLNSLGRRWPGFSFAPLSDDDARAFANAIGDSSRGAMADPSQLTERPVGFQLNQIPGTGDAHLLFYDISGEAFDSSTKLTKHAFFIPASDVITLVLSVHDISAGHELGFLLARLVDAIRLQGQDPSTKSLIVVLTKGDLLREESGLPLSAESFLTNEAPADPRSLDELQLLSDALREWLREHPDNYWNFVESAETEFANVRYTVISSLGSAPGTTGTQIQMNPRNVISPLLWLLRFSLPWIRVTTKNVPESHFHYYDLCTAHEETSPHHDNLLFELSPGDHKAKKLLKFCRHADIRGAGMDTTRILAEPGTTAISVDGGSFAARDITFVSHGSLSSSTVTVSNSDIHFTSCKFTNAMCAETESRLGNGLHISGATTGEIEGSEFLNNQRNGLLIEGTSEVSVRRCIASRNGRAGFRFGGSSKVTTQNSQAFGNKQGVHVSGKSRVEITRNRCSNNEEAGILCTDNSSGEAKTNDASNERKFEAPLTQMYGIVLRDNTNFDLLDNECCNNAWDGIHARGNSLSTVKGNKATSNGCCGVRVIERSRLLLEGNQCNRNSYGIHVHCSARGTRVKQSNECTDNLRYGFQNLRTPIWYVIYWLSVMLYDEPVGPSSPG